MTRVDISLLGLPKALEASLKNAECFVNDIGRSEANVIFIQKDGGMYLKIDAAGSLRRAYDMQRFLHVRGLSVECVEYISADRDYLLSRAAAGECAISEKYLRDPAKLTVAIAEAARALHDLNPADCPYARKTREFLRDFDA